jgi:uncharacterized membrane protein YbjE (DUF340 family)
MFIYGTIMVAGILVGAKCSWIPSESKFRRKLQYLFLFVLLFVLGHQLGSDEAVVSSISEMGFYGLVIALVSMLGSFSFVVVLRKIFEQKEKVSKDD